MSLPNSPSSPPSERSIATLAQLEEMFGDQNPSNQQTSGVAFLLAVSGPHTGRLFIVNRLEQVLGRAAFADIRIEERAVSLQHAVLVKNEFGYRLVDLGSTNGTFVNERRIEEHELRSGDVVRIGQTTLAYLAAGDRGAAEQTMTLQRFRPPLPTLVPEFALEPVGERALVPAQGAEPEGAGFDQLIGKALMVWAFARRNWVWLVSLPLLFGAVGLVSLRYKPPKEYAAFVVSFVPTPARNPMEQGWEPRNDRVEFFRLPERTFGSPELVRETLAALGEENVSDERVADVAGGLELKPAGAQNWQGIYSHASGGEAERFLKKHLEFFLQHEIELTMKVISAEVDFLQKQLNETEADLSRTERDLKQFKEKHLSGLPEQAREQLGSLFDLKTRRRELEAELERVQSELKLGREKLGSKDPTLEHRVAASEPYQAAITEVRQKIAEAKASGLGERHPKLVELRRQEKHLKGLSSRMVNAGSSEVDERASTSYMRVEDHVKALRAQESVVQKELGRVHGDIAQIEGVVKDLPDVEAKYAQLSRSYDGTKELHGRLFQQLKRAQLQHELERATAEAHYDIIDPPKAIRPSKAKHGAMRGAGGFFIGLVLAIMIGSFRELRARVRRYLARGVVT